MSISTFTKPKNPTLNFPFSAVRHMMEASPAQTELSLAPLLRTTSLLCIAQPLPMTARKTMISPSARTILCETTRLLVLLCAEVTVLTISRTGTQEEVEIMKPRHKRTSTTTGSSWTKSRQIDEMIGDTDNCSFSGGRDDMRKCAVKRETRHYHSRH